MNKMINKIAMMAALITGGLFCVYGATAKLGTDTVVFDGAEATTAGGDLVLTFKASGSLSLPRNAHARVLAVGGGGAGGSIGDSVTRGAAGGGGGGGVRERELILAGGVYDIAVGKGGQRVQTTVQSWTGDDGDRTKMTRVGETVIAAPGGGGGGSVKVNGSGTNGGCGGGGAWYGEILDGGTGTDGYGWAGGTPSAEDFGGGGGGANEDPSLGRGGANGAAGAGRTSDISGKSVVYAKGGRGGNRNDGSYEAKDATGIGCGGDGAVEGAGGAGTDGIMIVRISSFFDYKMVDFPSYTAAFNYANGQTCTVFDPATVAEPLKSGIDSVTGVTSVKCKTVGEEHQGLGRYQFSITLKPEYRWNDGSAEGSTGAYTCYWRVKDPDVVASADIQATKTVSWTSGTNAIITLEANATPEKKMDTPNVLVLGSLCGAHGLNSTVVNTLLNSICEIGNVDYYFYNKCNTASTPTPGFSGHMNVGETRSGTVYSSGRTTLEKTESNHGTLYAFYSKLGELMDSGKLDEYAYIVFSFDGSQVATYFPTTAHPKEDKIAAKMKEYYKNNRVIWLVDHESEANTSLGISQRPWFPSPMCWVSGSGYNYWASIGYYQCSWGGDNSSPYGYTAYKALMGLFAPDKYASISTSNYDSMTTKTSSWTSTSYNHNLTYNGVMNQAGTAIANQCVYDDADEVADLIARVVVAKPMYLRILDRVAVDAKGLQIVDVKAQWTTGGVTTVCSPEEISIDDDGNINVTVGQVLDPAYIRADVEIVDQGGFRSSVGATYNEQTGRWEKDPNDGTVKTSLIYEDEAVVVEAEAATAVQWSFDAFRITGGIKHGEGEFVINGFITNEYYVAEGYTPEVVFRGKAGYVLDYLEIDGLQIKDITKDTYNHTFEKIGCNHDIQVGFTSVLNLSQAPVAGAVTCEYDGKAHGCTVTAPTFADGYDFEWYPVYSLSGKDGTFSKDIGAIDAGTTEVYVRIAIKGQKGYDENEGAELTSWTGKAPVTITKRSIAVKVSDEIQAGAQVPTSEFSYIDLSDNLAEGDTMTAAYTVAYPAQGSSAPINATMTVKDASGRNVTGNYIITVTKGTYTNIGEQSCAATADDIVKAYDGNAASITLNVIKPTGVTNGKTTTDTTAKTLDPAANNKNIGTRYNTDYVDGKNKKTGMLYNCVSNETCKLTKQVTTDNYSVKYSVDNGNTWVDQLPSYTDAGTYTVKYKVAYSQTVTKTVEHTLNMYGYTFSYSTANNKKKNICFDGDKNKTSKTWTTTTTETVPWTTFEGTSSIVIKPVKVTLTAKSKDKPMYDGKELKEPGFDITPADAFVGAQGVTASMTADSKITLPGEVANVIDQASLKYKPGTKASNYDISFVNGKLTVGMNPLSASANIVTKEYDGTAADPVNITIVDKNGNAVPAGAYTIKYASNPWDPFTTTKPASPTDAGEYALYYIVDGGPGYGVVTNHTVITVAQRTITVKANSATHEYDGLPFTAGATVTGDFVTGEGIAKVEMTDDSVITYPGKVANKVGNITFKNNTKAQNYRIVKVDGELTVTRKLRFEVTDDGEFSFDMPDGPGNMVIVVDGTTNSVTKVAEGRYAVHVAEPSKGYSDPSAMDTCQDHVIEFVFTEDDGEIYPDNVVWYPSADENEIYGVVVNLDPPEKNVEKIKKSVTIYNDPYSGWLPVMGKDDKGNDCVVAIRTSDGAENDMSGDGNHELVSHFQLVVNGTGEIKFGNIMIPVRYNDELNPDHGAMTITIDGHSYTIPPLVDLDERCTVVTNGDTVVIKDLVLRVSGAADGDHFVTMTYSRDADSTVGNTCAYVSDISWKSYGETNDGGTSWIQDKKLWIIDHEDAEDEGYVYLCFRPQLKVEEELADWVKRSSDNEKIMVKFGQTVDAMEKCEPVVAKLSEKHKIEPVKIWVRVPIASVVKTAAYWKIYIDGSNGTDPETSGPASDGDPAETQNTFGVLEIKSKDHYTMISIPWTDYSLTSESAQAIPVEKLVKADGLEDGDMIYSYASNDTYAVWMLDRGDWAPQKTFVVAKDGSQSTQFIAGEDETRAARGNALWVVRQNPVDSKGNPKSIFIYGQTSDKDAVTEVAGGTTTKAGFTTMGYPGTDEININDIDWGSNPITKDMITIPGDGNTSVKLAWKRGKWGYSVMAPDANGRLVATRVDGYQLKPGQAFWYTRYGAKFNVKWPKKVVK